MSDGRIIIDTSVDNSGLEKGVNSLESVAKTGLKVFTGAIVGTGTAMAGVSYKALSLASDLTEVQNVVDVTFGENASKINDWAKAAATSFGMSELQAKQFNGTMGAMLKSMGLTGDEVLNLSQNMTGLAGDFASFYNLDTQDAFDKIRSGISGETEPLKQLGINMSVANMEAYALSQGITKAYKNMSQSEQTLLRYNYLMSVSADAQGDFTRTQDSFANQLRIAKLNVQDLGATLGNMLLPVAQETVKSFNGVTEKLKAAFADPAVQESIKKLATAMGELITKVANFVVDNLPKIIEGFTWMIDNSDYIAAGIIAIGVAMVTLNVANMIMRVVKAFQLAQLATEGLTVAQWLLNVAMSLNPIGILIAIIAGLIAAVIYLWNTNEDFRNAIISIWETIKETAMSVWGAICDFFTETIPAAFQTVMDFFAGIGAWFEQLWISIGQLFIDGWNAIVSFFTETIPVWIASVIAWFNELPRNIGYMLGYLLGCFVNGLKLIWDIITVTIPAIITSVITWFSELPGRIMAWLIVTITNIVIWGTQLKASVDEWVSNTINGIIDWFSQLPTRIWEWLVTTIINIVLWLSDMNEKCKQGARDVVNGIIQWFSDLPGNMLDIGRNIVTGIWDGITGAKDWLFDKIGGFASGIADGFMDALDINSPSRVMRDKVGKFIPQGIGVGMDKEMPNLLGNVDTNMNDLVARMKGTVDYETARTTAGVVASRNKVTGVDTIGDTSKGNNKTTIEVPVIIDGKEFMRATAPYQEVYDEYNVGRG